MIARFAEAFRKLKKIKEVISIIVGSYKSFQMVYLKIRVNNLPIDISFPVT